MLEAVSVKLYRGFPRLQDNYLVLLKITFTLHPSDAALPALTQEISS